MSQFVSCDDGINICESYENEEEEHLVAQIPTANDPDSDDDTVEHEEVKFHDAMVCLQKLRFYSTQIENANNAETLSKICDQTEDLISKDKKFVQCKITQFFKTC